MDERTTYAKTMISTGRDFGLAEWINLPFFENQDWIRSNKKCISLSQPFLVGQSVGNRMQSQVI